MMLLGILMRGSAPPLSVSADDVTKVTTGSGTSGVVTSDAGASNTVTTGGATPYSFAWSHLSTSSGNTPSISDATVSEPTWSATVSQSTDSVSSWKVTVTDSIGTTAEDTITVTLSWTNTS